MHRYLHREEEGGKGLYGKARARWWEDCAMGPSRPAWRLLHLSGLLPLYNGVLSPQTPWSALSTKPESVRHLLARAHEMGAAVTRASDTCLNEICMEENLLEGRRVWTRLVAAHAGVSALFKRRTAGVPFVRSPRVDEPVQCRTRPEHSWCVPCPSSSPIRRSPLASGGILACVPWAVGG